MVTKAVVAAVVTAVVSAVMLELVVLARVVRAEMFLAVTALVLNSVARWHKQKAWSAAPHTREAKNEEHNPRSWGDVHINVSLARLTALVARHMSGVVRPELRVHVDTHHWRHHHRLYHHWLSHHRLYHRLSHRLSHRLGIASHHRLVV